MPEAVDRVDVGRFAQVVTCDPHRSDGARSSRIEEFEAGAVFLEEPLEPSPEGVFQVPQEGGKAAIGLRWADRRLVREVVLPRPLPGEGDPRLELWVGESWWQGEWVVVEAIPDHGAEGLSWKLATMPGGAEMGTWKVRLILDAGATSIAVPRPEAYTATSWRDVHLVAELDQGACESPATFQVYNGVLIDGPDQLVPGQAHPMVVRAAETSDHKGDRSALWIRLEGGGVSVAIEDLLRSGAVRLTDLGLTVRLPGEPARGAQGRRTMLGRLRDMPEQTLEAAFASVHNPVQNKGPVLLSMPAGNRKIIADADASLRMKLRHDQPDQTMAVYEAPFWVSCRLGGLEPDDLQRMWSTQTMPMQLLLGQEGEVSYRHAAFMAPYPDDDWDGVAWTGRSVGVLEICASGQGAAKVELGWGHDGEVEPETSQVDDGITVTAEGRRVLWVRCSRGALEAHESGASWTVDPEGSEACLEILVPDPESPPDDMSDWVVSDLHRKAMECWERFLQTGATVSLPDELLHSIVAMSRVHCAAAARHEAGGRRIAPWIASISYGPLESESHSVILGMDGMGHGEFGRRGLDFFIGRYNPHGFLTTGYTTMGTGWHLWTLGEHVLLHGDTDWLGERSAEVARACRWVMRERRKTGGRLPSGDPVPERGLMPPSVIADWNVFEYRWFQQGSYCAGLELAGEALSRCGHPAARSILLDAAELRREILRAYDWAQARTPAVELQSGQWVPGSPGMLRAFGPIHDAYPGEDHQRSWAGDAELGPNHLVPLGVLKPGDRRTDWLVDQLEDNLCLRTGMGDYDEESNRADWSGRGGFCKLQPYYGRLAEVHALRDDRKAFLRSYLNAIPSLVSRELMSFWEHFANMGAWNKTHETGWFLRQTRTMLVQERGDDLWLAPFIPAEWLVGDEPLVVENLPTRFGPVSYRIEPDGKGDAATITVRPPHRRDPAALILRLAHPEDRDITGLSIDDAPQPVPPDGLVRLPAACAEVRAMVHYS